LGGTAAMEALHQQAEATAQAGLGGKRYERLFRDGAGRDLGVVVGLATRDVDKLPPVLRGPLTKREQEIGVLVGQGLTNGQIARRLVISSRTVDTHVASIYAKLGVSSRVQFVTWLNQQADFPEPAP
jgi:DNA-binding NarL/FixJ family response regulator